MDEATNYGDVEQTPDVAKIYQWELLVLGRAFQRWGAGGVIRGDGKEMGALGF